MRRYLARRVTGTCPSSWRNGSSYRLDWLGTTAWFSRSVGMVLACNLLRVSESQLGQNQRGEPSAYYLPVVFFRKHLSLRTAARFHSVSPFPESQETLSLPISLSLHLLSSLTRNHLWCAERVGVQADRYAFLLYYSVAMESPIWPDIKLSLYTQNRRCKLGL